MPRRVQRVQRGEGYRSWRSGIPGLARLQTRVDNLLAALSGSEEAHLLVGGLADLKLKVNKEVRDNAAFEIRARREYLELFDLERASKSDITLIRQLSAQIEGKFQDLLKIDDMQRALATPTEGPDDPEPATPEPGNPQPDQADVAQIAPESMGSSQMNLDGTPMDPPLPGAGSSESIPEDDSSRERETSGPQTEATTEETGA